MAVVIEGLAQKDPKAKVVLDGMSQKYASIKGLKASFEFSYSDVSDGRSQNQSGEIKQLFHSVGIDDVGYRVSW